METARNAGERCRTSVSPRNSANTVARCNQGRVRVYQGDAPVLNEAIDHPDMTEELAEELYLNLDALVE